MNPVDTKFWLGDHPRPCTCLNGPCDGGEDGCGYDPMEWGEWEAWEHASKDPEEISDRD